MTPEEITVRLKLKRDLTHYAYKCLYIRTKDAKIVPFAFNAAQLYLHKQLEEQKLKTGKVRAIILKGRQQGISTYVAARFYHIVSHRTGYRAFIMAHLQGATDNLFEIVKRYHDYCPIQIKPIEGRNNVKEFNFISPESGYKVGSAETKEVGRSSTIQLFHGSEVALWANANAHSKGILEAVPLIDNTEIILESTANGKGNYFYRVWESAMKGRNGFIPIFIPWYWDAGYKLPVPEGFSLSTEEASYQRIYGLTKEQMAWRRYKINGLLADDEDDVCDELSFKQEYPSNAEEAFITTGDKSLIGNLEVQAARSCEAMAAGVKFVGVDPAGRGKDRTSIIRRQGRVAYNLQTYKNLDTMQIVGLIVRIIQDEGPDYVCVDTIGYGAGIGDRLIELGYGNIVQCINCSRKAYNSDRYHNLRAEMWSLMGLWLQEPPVQIPNSNSLHADLCAPFFKNDSQGRIQLESKEDMKSNRGVRSPDEGDALALTFSFPGARKNANIDNIFTPNIRI
jgi:hypothetical protein